MRGEYFDLTFKKAMHWHEGERGRCFAEMVQPKGDEASCWCRADDPLAALAPKLRARGLAIHEPREKYRGMPLRFLRVECLEPADWHDRMYRVIALRDWPRWLPTAEPGAEADQLGIFPDWSEDVE